MLSALIAMLMVFQVLLSTPDINVQCNVTKEKIECATDSKDIVPEVLASSLNDVFTGSAVMTRFTLKGPGYDVVCRGGSYAGCYSSYYPDTGK